MGEKTLPFSTSPTQAPPRSWRCVEDGHCRSAETLYAWTCQAPEEGPHGAVHVRGDAWLRTII